MRDRFFIDETGTGLPIEQFPAINRGLLYGDGFFTTLRVSQGHTLFWAAHVKRMEQSSDYLSFALPTSSDDLRNTLQARCGASGEFRCRISFIRSGNGKYVPETDTSIALVEIDRLSANAFEFGAPRTIEVIESPRIIFHYANRFKLLNKVPQLRTGIELKSKGLNDGILLNEGGNPVELLSSNLTIVKKGRALTPPLEDGGLAGTIRDILLEEGLAEEESLTIKDLEEAEEIFATNSIVGAEPLWYQKDREMKETRRLFEWLRDSAD